VRSRRAGSRLWPGGLKCSYVGFIAGGAGGVQLPPAQRAAAGSRASCSPQRVFGGRLQACSRRAGSRFWPGGLKCSYVGFIAGGAGGVQLSPAQRAAAGRRASCSPQRDFGGRLQVRSRHAGLRLWPGGLKCSCVGFGAGGAGGVQLLPAQRGAAGRRASCSLKRGSGGRLQLRSRRAGSRLWPGGPKCSCAGLGAGEAGGVQLLPAQRAAAGRRASCSPQRGSGGRPQLRSRRAGTRLWPGGLKCSYVGFIAGGAGGVQPPPAQRATAGRRASRSPQRDIGGRLQVRGRCAGSRLWPGGLKCSYVVRRRRSWRCPAAAGSACWC
jgi:hypothetical protein